MRNAIILIYCVSLIFNAAVAQEPVRIGVAGLSHSHVLPLLRNLDRKDIQIVGIAERDTALAGRYTRQFGLDKSLIYQSLDEMLDKTKPAGVLTFQKFY